MSPSADFGQREQMEIRGRLCSPDFLPWIARHAAKLGLVPVVASAGADCVTLEVDGDGALLDMLEMGCLLGPIDVWVESIERRRLFP